MEQGVGAIQGGPGLRRPLLWPSRGASHKIHDVKTRLILVLFLVSVLAYSADVPPLVLRIPGFADSIVTVESLRKAGTRELTLSSEQGEPATYKGVPLLDVLEAGGLELKGMGAERRLAPAVVVASGRDSYAVAFSIGELAMHRSDPCVFLTGETTGGALPPDQGPIRLVVTGQRARSAFALAKIEVRFLAENKPSRKS